MQICYHGLATRRFKSYIDKSGNADSDAKNAFYVVAQVLATYKIEAEQGTYTQSPSLLLIKMTFDFENAARLQSKLKAVEKSLTLYYQIQCRCSIQNGFTAEIPRKQRQLVGLGDVLRVTDHILPCSIGIKADNTLMHFDLAKAPHLLIAGATGSGKSVCMNDIILSLMAVRNPQELKFIMIDPKKVELSQYTHSYHRLFPIVTDCNKALAVLQRAINMMNARYEIMSQRHVRDISEIEGLFSRVVIIIDELSVLMMQSPRETERAIETIAAEGRAAGIHLIVATQSPTAKVTTGRIKANIPTRIAFTTAGITESKVILDYGGAEKLLGKGDGLYTSPYQTGFTRFQSAYVSSEEIQNAMKTIATPIEEEH